MRDAERLPELPVWASEERAYRSRGQGGFVCRCTAGRFGERCEEESDGCGGEFQQLSGTIRFPDAGPLPSYLGGQRCRWLIRTLPGLVLLIVFEEGLRQDSNALRRST